MKGEAIFLVESWAIGDIIISTRRAIVPSSQMLSSLRRSSSMSRLVQLYSAEARVDSDCPDDESDVAVDNIDCNVPE